MPFLKVEEVTHLHQQITEILMLEVNSKPQAEEESDDLEQ